MGLEKTPKLERPKDAKEANISAYLEYVSNSPGDGFPASFLKTHGPRLKIYCDKEGRHTIENGSNAAGNWLSFLREAMQYLSLDISSPGPRGWAIIDDSFMQMMRVKCGALGTDWFDCISVRSLIGRIEEMLFITANCSAGKIIREAQKALDSAYKKDAAESELKITSDRAMTQSCVERLLKGSLEPRAVKKARSHFQVNGEEWDDVDPARLRRGDRKLLSKLQSLEATQDPGSDAQLLVIGMIQNLQKAFVLGKQSRRDVATNQGRKDAANARRRRMDNVTATNWFWDDEDAEAEAWKSFESTLPQ